MGLAAVETELLRHSVAEKRRWQEIARLLMQVEGERLWEGHAPSFTAWLQGMARRADLQESVFWRCLKAGRIYHELTGGTSLDEAGATVSAESLELADKISRHAPKAVTQEVLSRALGGEISRGELREVWSTYKPAAGGTTARGRLPSDDDAREQAVAARRALWESQKRNPENRGEVRRAEMLSSFREARFLSRVDQVRAEPRAQHLGKGVSSLLVVRRSATQPERIELHGLWTCVSAPELSDFEYEAKGGIDFMWLAVTPELSASAGSKAPRLAGVLELTSARGLRVVREAERRPVRAEGRVAVLTELLQRAYLWP
jgi:hypothetical protein